MPPEMPMATKRHKKHKGKLPKDVEWQITRLKKTEVLARSGATKKGRWEIV